MHMHLCHAYYVPSTEKKPMLANHCSDSALWFASSCYFVQDFSDPSHSQLTIVAIQVAVMVAGQLASYSQLDSCNTSCILAIYLPRLLEYQLAIIASQVAAILASYCYQLGSCNISQLKQVGSYSCDRQLQLVAVLASQ